MATVNGSFALAVTVTLATAGHKRTYGSMALAETVSIHTRGDGFSLTPPAAPPLTLTPATTATLVFG